MPYVQLLFSHIEDVPMLPDLGRDGLDREEYFRHDKPPEVAPMDFHVFDS